MPYYKTTTIAGRCIEVVKHMGKRIVHEGPRRKKHKPTPEEMAAVNERNAIRKLTLILNANFTEGDHWLTLTYPKYYKPSPEEAIQNVKDLLKELRKEYRQHGSILKYVWIKEYKTTGIHHHLVIKDIENANFLKILRKHWSYGTHDKELYSVEYSKLAEYMIKETSKTFKEKEAGSKQRYSCSRNMIRPLPVTELISRSNAWREIPKAPKGYFIPEALIHNSVDCYGYKIQRYTLVSLAGNAPPPYIVSMEELKRWQQQKEEYEKELKKWNR